MAPQPEIGAVGASATLQQQRSLGAELPALQADVKAEAVVIADPSAMAGAGASAKAEAEAEAPAATAGRNLRVLIISPVFPPHVAIGGGVAITCGALTDKLIDKGCEVRVLSPRLSNIDYGESSLYPAFPVMFPTVFNLRLLNEAIREADAVVAPDNTIMMFLLFMSHYHGVPIVFNLHTNVRQLLSMTGTFGKYVSAPVCDSFIRMCSLLTARTFTTSQSYRAVLRERGYRIDDCFSPRIKLSIFEAADADADVAEARVWLSGGHVEKTVLMFVGRFSHEKRIPLLVRALPAGVVLAVVGDGPEPSGSEVAALHDPARLVFVHRGIQNQARLRLLYKACDFLVSASAFETLGMTVAEANLCGTPAICQDATGFNTQIVHGKNGFLIDYEDAKAAAKLIERAVAHAPKPQQIAAFLQGPDRWDAALPNLEDLVLEVAITGKDKSTWKCPSIPSWLFAPFVALFYVVFWVAGVPFNQVTSYADRAKIGPAVFNAKRRAPTVEM